MERYFLSILIVLISIGCKQAADHNIAETKSDVETIVVQETNYAQYGAKITADNALGKQAVLTEYNALKVGDTTAIKFSAPIESVCANKGCWMRLTVDADNEVFIKFKDYGFFVPVDASGEAVVQGKAFVEEVSIEEQQHLALDAGRSADYIAAITEPKREYRFLAEGVLIKE